MRSQVLVTSPLTSLLCCLLAFQLYSAQADPCTPVHPSHGDVRLLGDIPGSGVVLVYMGPDETDVDELWATINGNIRHGNVAKTLCQQLGYNAGSMTTFPSQETNRTVWLSDITCPLYDAKHILRCKSTFNAIGSNAAMDHTGDVHLTCTDPTARDHTVNDASTYIGQATLLPPSNALSCQRSRSYGVVTIKHYSYRWDYIKSNSPLDGRVTNTICREMGYTHAVRNSLLTVGQSNLAFVNRSYSFEHFGHIDSSNVSCLSSCPCIGCCYNLTDFTAVGQASPKFDVLVEKDDDAVIVRCSYYTPVSPSTPPNGGHRDVCEVLFQNGAIRNQNLCPTDASADDDSVTFTKRQFAAIVTAPTCFLLLIIIGICFVRPVYRTVRNWRQRRQGYQNVQGLNDGRGGGGGGGNDHAGGSGGSGGNQGN